MIDHNMLVQNWPIAPFNEPILPINNFIIKCFFIIPFNIFFHFLKWLSTQGAIYKSSIFFLESTYITLYGLFYCLPPTKIASTLQLFSFKPSLKHFLNLS